MSRICLFSNWKELVVTSTQSFDECLIALNSGKTRCVLVVNSQNKLVGIVTDGDVRRAIIRGVSRSDDIGNVMNSNPYSVLEGCGDKIDIETTARRRGILHVPIVCNSGTLVGLYVDESLKIRPILDERFVIMAGGLGKRLRPLTLTVPKPMLEMRGKPVLEHLIEKAQSEGFNRVVISINYLGNIIQDYFKDGKDFNIDINYLLEDKPLGTAGCLNLLSEEDPEQFSLITNGDIVVDADYSNILEFAKICNCDALMVVKRFELKNPFGVIETSGEKIVDIKEKPVYTSLINAGIYAIKNRIINDMLDGSYMDMPNLFRKAVASGLDVRYYILNKDWIDIGSYSEYMKVR